MRDLRADPRQAERFGDGSNDRHRPVGRNRECAVDAVPAGDLDDLVHILEVDDFADVGSLEPRGGAVPVDRDDAEAELLGALDCAALMTACSDEEDGLPAHPRRA